MNEIQFTREGPAKVAPLRAGFGVTLSVTPWRMASNASPMLATRS